MLSRLVTVASRWPGGAGRGLVTLLMMALITITPAASAQPGGLQPPGEEGSPILIVASYTTTPSPVVSGQDFSLAVTLKNTGTKHADDIFASVASGGPFVGIGAPAPVGKLDPEFSASFSLQVHAQDGLSSGAYDLPLDFLYRIGESGAFEIVRSVGIQVSGGSTGAPGKPQVVVEKAEVISPPAAVGDRFELQLTLRNVGARRATGVTASLKLNDALSPAEGSGTTQVGNLDVNQSATFSLRMVVDQANPSGRVLQTMTLEYGDADGGRYTSDETVGVDLGAEGRKRPQLILAGYSTDPARPSPGESVALTLQVMNVGAGDARRLLVRLGDEAGLRPFAPLGTSNVSFVPEIAANTTITLSRTLLVDGAAVGGAYPIKVSLAYENIVGEAQTEMEIISLLVLARPQMQISLFEPVVEPLVVGEEFEIPVEVVNIGRQTVNVSTVEMVSDDLTLTEASLYLGPLDAGTSGSLAPKATARQAGTAQVAVVIHYLDDFNQEQTVTHTLTFTIEPSSAATDKPDEEEAEPSLLEKIWRGILGFFGLGG